MPICCHQPLFDKGVLGRNSAPFSSLAKKDKKKKKKESSSDSSSSSKEDYNSEGSAATLLRDIQLFPWPTRPL